MSGTFDPYHAWLEIPPAEQPPHHYRLLGLPLYEGNSAIISLAADRQISFLESVDDSEHGFLADQLIKSIDAARTCLLDAQRKATYDAKLRSKLSPSAAAGKPAVAKTPSAPVEVAEIEDYPEESAWQEPPAWMADAPATKPAQKPASTPARAQRPATAPPRPLPRAKSTADSSDEAGDALSFLAGPGGKRPSVVESASGPRAKTPSVAPAKGGATNPRNANPKDAAQDKKPNTSRMMAIFIPTIVTLLALVVYVALTGFGGGDDKKKSKADKTDKAKPASQSFDDMWSKSGLPKGVPAAKPK